MHTPPIDYDKGACEIRAYLILLHLPSKHHITLDIQKKEMSTTLHSSSSASDSSEIQPPLTISKWYSYYEHQFAYIQPPQTLVSEYAMVVNIVNKDGGSLIIVHPNEEVAAFCIKLERALELGSTDHKRNPKQETTAAASLQYSLMLKMDYLPSSIVIRRSYLRLK